MVDVTRELGEAPAVQGALSVEGFAREAGTSMPFSSSVAPKPRWRAASFIEKASLEEAPRGAVVKVEAAIGTKVLAREELAVSARDESHELFVAQLIELFGRDRLADSELACFHRIVGKRQAAF